MESLQEIMVKLLTARFIVSGIALSILFIVLLSMGGNIVYLLIAGFVAIVVTLVILLGKS